MTSGSSPSVVGEAAIALHRVAYTLDQVRNRLTAYGAGPPQRTAGEAVDALGRLGRELETLADELATQLGQEHDARTAFVAARGAVDDIVAALGPLSDSDFPDSREVDEAVEEIAKGRADFDTSRSGFMEASRGAAGGE